MSIFNQLQALKQSPSKGVRDEIEIERLEQEWDYISSFTNDILSQDLTLEYEDVVNIVEKHHSGRGYFSWDGILDDLAVLIGSEDKARDILRAC